MQACLTLVWVRPFFTLHNLVMHHGVHSFGAEPLGFRLQKAVRTMNISGDF